MKLKSSKNKSKSKGAVSIDIKFSLLSIEFFPLELDDEAIRLI